MIAAWCAGFALYLVCAGQVSLDEAISGAALAALATIWLARVRDASQYRFQFGREALSEALRALAGIAGATLRTAVILLRAAIRGGSPSTSSSQPLRQGTRDGPLDCGRRAVGVLAASLAPDSYVMTAERGRDATLHHAIVWRSSR